MYKIPYAGAEVKSFTPEIQAIPRRYKIPPCSEALRNILIEVCKELNVHPNDVIGRSHAPNLVFAREEFIWRARTTTDASFPRIAKVLDRDHSTAVYHFHLRKARLQNPEAARKPRSYKIMVDTANDAGRLTERQEKVRSLLLRGYNNYDISVELGVSSTIVKQDKKIIQIIRPLPKISSDSRKHPDERQRG